jgi:prepilin-type processing-associated H-X9-DG protein
MNFWGACAGSWGPVSGRLKAYKPGQNPFDSSEGKRGKAFDANVDAASNTLILADAWGMWPSESPAGYTGETRWFTGAHIGRSGLPGERFGGGANPVNAALQEGLAWKTKGAPEMAGVSGNVLPSYIPYYRYPKPNVDALTREGSAMFGFVDGHVDPIRAADLVDPLTGKSTYRVLWSPIDRDVEDTSSGS